MNIAKASVAWKRQLAPLPIEEPWPPASPAAVPECDALLMLADAAASAGLDREEAHLRRAAALVDGPDRWAARPYITQMFLGTARDRRQRAHQGGRFDRYAVARLGTVARLYLAAVQVVRRVPREAHEVDVEVFEDGESGSAVASWSMVGPSAVWPHLYHGASVNAWRYPSGRLWVELQVCFPDASRSRFVLTKALRSRDASIQTARRWAALGAALIRSARG